MGCLSPLLQRVRFAAAREWVRGDRILDIGCGLADFCKLSPKGSYYVGLERDLSRASAAINRHPGIRVATGDLVESPYLLDEFLDIPFDCIVMIAVLEHLSDPQSFLSRLKRVLAPNGRLVVTTPAPIGKVILELGSWLGLSSRDALEEHETLFSPQTLKDLMKKVSFQIEHYERFLFGLNQLIVARAS